MVDSDVQYTSSAEEVNLSEDDVAVVEETPSAIQDDVQLIEKKDAGKSRELLIANLLCFLVSITINRRFPRGYHGYRVTKKKNMPIGYFSEK